MAHISLSKICLSRKHRKTYDIQYAWDTTGNSIERKPIQTVCGTLCRRRILDFDAGNNGSSALTMVTISLSDL